jgi:hypothetical protein
MIKPAHNYQEKLLLSLAADPNTSLLFGDATPQFHFNNPHFYYYVSVDQ